MYDVPYYLFTFKPCTHAWYPVAGRRYCTFTLRDDVDTTLIGTTVASYTTTTLQAKPPCTRKRYRHVYSFLPWLDMILNWTMLTGWRRSVFKLQYCTDWGRVTSNAQSPLSNWMAVVSVTLRYPQICSACGALWTEWAMLGGTCSIETDVGTTRPNGANWTDTLPCDPPNGQQLKRNEKKKKIKDQNDATIILTMRRLVQKKRKQNKSKTTATLRTFQCLLMVLSLPRGHGA